VRMESTVARPKPGVWSDIKVGGLLAYAAVWAFFIVFLIYPLTRLFYDSFTTEAGVFTLSNFQDFFTDAFYLKSLMNSMILGVATVITTSMIGAAGPVNSSQLFERNVGRRSRSARVMAVSGLILPAGFEPALTARQAPQATALK